jgi:predicted RNase H-like HicB family nuclease/metal-responsive CopG/Arc/MetJ family transcriptional regulator
MRQYIALIHKDAGSDYGVSFPDLPGCITAGVDLDDARRMAEEALALHLAGMAEDDEPIPEPSSLEAVMADRENRDAVAILVRAPVATTKAVRVNMTIPEDELEQIDEFATQHGYTRSGFLLYAAKKAIGVAEAAKAKAATAKANLARVKADAADPLKHLSELVEISYAAENVSHELWHVEVESKLKAKLDAVVRGGESEPTDHPLETTVDALLRNMAEIDAMLRNIVKTDAMQKAIVAELKNDAKADEAQLRENRRAKRT